MTFPANPPPSRSVLLIAVGPAENDEDAKEIITAFAALAVENDFNNTSNWRVTVRLTRVAPI